MDRDWEGTLLNSRDEGSLFRFLDPGQIETVVDYLDTLHLPAGTVLFHEGDKGDFFGILSSGRLEVKKKTEFEGNQILMAVLTKGAFIGELSMVDDQPRGATVRAIEPTDMYVMRRDRFQDLITEHPQIGISIYQAISRILSVRLRVLAERFSEIF